MSASSADLPRPIDVFEAARTASVVAGRVPLAAFERVRPSMPVLRGDLVYRFEGLTDPRGRAAARLHYEATVPLTCDRCGTVVDVPLQGQASYYFVRSESELARIPVDDSDEEPLLGSARFDLMELLEDELILALPLSPRHPDCEPPGLPVVPDEAAAQPERPHPFASLAGFKGRRQ